MDGAHPLSCGDLLKRYRITARLTQEELAERSQMSVRTIGNIERGSRHAPRRDSVRLLAAALTLSPQEYAVFAAAARESPLSPVPLLGTESPLVELLQSSTTVATNGATSTFATSYAPQRSMRPRLVGRAREVAQLHHHLSSPPGDDPPLLLISGEPGIGKTRLLHEAVARAVGAGWCVLEGSCPWRGGQHPYTPLLEALERHVHRQPPAALRTFLAGCARLVRLLPELVEQAVVTAQPSVLPPEQERRLLFQAVEHYLANVAGPAGTLLVLDDLQWAGADALDLLATLVRSTAIAAATSAAPPPLRIVGTYRSTEVRAMDPLGMVLAELGHVQLVRQLVLEPLPAADARALLGEVLNGEGSAAGDSKARDESARKTLQRAGGVPQFLMSCAQAMRDVAATEGPTAAQNWNGCPPDVVQSIQQRVAVLPEAAPELLSVVAVAGSQASRLLLLEVAAGYERTEGEVIVALEAACKARLLVEVGEQAYAFANDLIREAIVADLSAARRAALHRQVAEAREQMPDRLNSRGGSTCAINAVSRQTRAPAERRNRTSGPAARAGGGKLKMLR